MILELIFIWKNNKNLKEKLFHTLNKLKRNPKNGQSRDTYNTGYKTQNEDKLNKAPQGKQRTKRAQSFQQT
jgi:hypothetical protein